MSKRGKATGFWAPASDRDLPWESMTVSTALPSAIREDASHPGRKAQLDSNHQSYPAGKGLYGLWDSWWGYFFSKPPAITATVARLPF